MTDEQKAKTPRALTPGAYYERVKQLRTDIVAIAEYAANAARERVLGSLPEREAKLLERVPESRRDEARALAELEAREWLRRNGPNSGPAPAWMNETVVSAGQAIEVDHELGTTRRV